MHQIFGRSIRGATRAALGIAFGVGLMAPGGGCGHCEGAIRELVVRSVEVCELESCVEDGGVYRVGPDLNVRVVGDGPSKDAEFLLDDSGISADTFFLLDPDGQRVPVTISADSGGHSCRMGVGFGLEPEEPLPTGTYTLVLLVDDLTWPLAGGAAVQSHEGKEAFVRKLEVVAAADP